MEYGRGDFCLSYSPFDITTNLCFLFAAFCNLNVFSRHKVQEPPWEPPPLTCWVWPVEGMADSTRRNLSPFIKPLAQAVALLRNIYNRLHCFLLHHRTENMCYFSMDQPHSPKSQWQQQQQTKQRKLLQHCSFHFKYVCLSIQNSAMTAFWEYIEMTDLF